MTGDMYFDSWPHAGEDSAIKAARLTRLKGIITWLDHIGDHGHANVVREVLAGHFALRIILRTGETWPTPGLVIPDSPILVMVEDHFDGGVSGGPGVWSCVPGLAAWAAGVAIAGIVPNRNGASTEFFDGIVKSTIKMRRFLLVTTADALLSAWASAFTNTPHLTVDAAADIELPPDVPMVLQ